MRGKQPYHIHEHDGKRINLSKASLGDFCYHALSCGVDIYQLWAMSPNYHRSAVYPAIKATEVQIEHLKSLGYIFVDPPKINLN